MAILGLACLAVVGLLYFRAVGFGLVGDDVGFVHPDPDWLQHILRPSGQWHFYPLNTAVCALLGIVTGGHPAPLHMINLILHAGVGVALGAWLARFGLNVWIRLLVAVFFVSRGIHYEVVAWIKVPRPQRQEFLLGSLPPRTRDPLPRSHCRDLRRRRLHDRARAADRAHLLPLRRTPGTLGPLRHRGHGAAAALDTSFLANACR